MGVFYDLFSLFLDFHHVVWVFFPDFVAFVLP